MGYIFGIVGVVSVGSVFCGILYYLFNRQENRHQCEVLLYRSIFIALAIGVLLILLGIAILIRTKR